MVSHSLVLTIFILLLSEQYNLLSALHTRLTLLVIETSLLSSEIRICHICHERLSSLAESRFTGNTNTTFIFWYFRKEYFETSSETMLTSGLQTSNRDNPPGKMNEIKDFILHVDVHPRSVWVCVSYDHYSDRQDLVLSENPVRRHRHYECYHDECKSPPGTIFLEKLKLKFFFIECLFPTNCKIWYFQKIRKRNVIQQSTSLL